MAKTILSAVVLFIAIAITAYLSFYYAPVERTMGPIQKIFYLHLPSAFTSFVALFIGFVANVLYVIRRTPKWDWLGVASAEVDIVRRLEVGVGGEDGGEAVGLSRGVGGV